MSTSITLSGITKRFGATPRRARGAKENGGVQAAASSGPAVDHVNLVIEPGELFFLLGPSGCGKTTLLRMIAGFIEPSEGTISFTTADGKVRDVTNLPPNKRNTGMVFQSYALWPHMTVEANVAFGLTVRKVGGAERKRRVMEALGLVQMTEYADRKPTQLSGGQQQRVALARALVVRPDVLLLDEPLSNLDAKLRIELRSEIRRICKEAGSVADVNPGAGKAMTTVYVTHDQKEALSMADRVAIMRAGKVVQIGTPDELYRRPRSKFVAEFLGETNFVQGTVTGVESLKQGSGDGPVARHVTLRTAAGVVTSVSDIETRVGENVTCSIRPEAIRVCLGQDAGGGTSRANRFHAEIVESTYLGEMAQQVLLLDDAAGESPASGSVVQPTNAKLPGSNVRVRLKASVMNPQRAGQSGDRRVAAIVEPEDVVLLSE